MLKLITLVISFFCRKNFISLLLLLPLGLQNSNAQTNIAGIINQYAGVLNIDTCTNILSVTSSAGFNLNDKILIIQMQGANINESNAADFGVPTLNNTGLYETNFISAINGNQITMTFELINDYQLNGKVQIVRIPQYTDAIITADLISSPWNGSSGGVLALEVSGTLTMNADIVADGAGFRGGISLTNNPNDCSWLIPVNDYFYDNNDWRGASKGEGVGAFIPGKEAGRGAQANGGGGGNDHNSGGGGGSNTTTGGQGGRNDEPSAFGCSGSSPGIGGYALPFSSSRIFFGGGGGAGHSNNSQATDGGNGGGIVYLTVQQLIANNQIIRANGVSSDTYTGDGIGGGGAGGTLLLNVSLLTGNLVVTATGGNGGNVGNSNQNRCFGPGGGGSGGRILTNLTGNPGLMLSAQGGQPGIRINSSNSCNNTTGGATSGENGVTSTFPAIPQGTVLAVPAGIIQQPFPVIACEGDDVSFSIGALGGILGFQWQVNAGTGFVNISNDAIYSGTQTNTLSISNASINFNNFLYRCIVSGTSCIADIFSFPGILTVLPAPIPSFTYNANGATVFFTNNSTAALSFLWNFGDNTTSNEFSPVHVYPQEGAYSVTLTAWNNCDTSSLTIQISNYQVPQASISSDIAIGCNPFVVQYDGFATEFVGQWQWFFEGGTPQTSNLEDPMVVYSTPGNYSVQLIASNPAGADTSLLTNYVQVGGLPNPDFTYTINGTIVTFNNASSGGFEYNWDFGDAMSSAEANPTHLFGGEVTYLVSLTAFNDCGQTTITQELVFAFPPQAYFEASTASGCVPVVVEYNAAFSEIETWQWFFEGGIPATSNSPIPNVTYNNPGIFPVTLIVSNGYGSDTLIQTNSILVQSVPVADFQAVIDGFDVYFTNLTQGSINFQWDFGDNNSSYLIDPSHTYFNPGQYSVTLYAYNDCASDTITQIIQIQTAPTVTILSNTTQGCTPLTVQFTGFSPDNVNFWQWDFPGGDPAFSYSQYPVITYNTPGTYAVQLLASNGIGSATLTEVGLIQVVQEPIADFSYTVVGNTVYFTNNSSLADTYEWTFGDGSSNSSDDSPVHTFDQGGLYDVTLLALNTFCGSGVTFSIPVNYNSIAAINESFGVHLFPNPATDIIHLLIRQDIIAGDAVEATLYDTKGIPVFQKILYPGQAALRSGELSWPLSIGDLPTGVYFCRIRLNSGAVTWKKAEVIR